MKTKAEKIAEELIENIKKGIDHSMRIYKLQCKFEEHIKQEYINYVTPRKEIKGVKIYE